MLKGGKKKIEQSLSNLEATKQALVDDFKSFKERLIFPECRLSAKCRLLTQGPSRAAKNERNIGRVSKEI